VPWLIVKDVGLADIPKSTTVTPMIMVWVMLPPCAVMVRLYCPKSIWSLGEVIFRVDVPEVPRVMLVTVSVAVILPGLEFESERLTGPAKAPMLATVIVEFFEVVAFMLIAPGLAVREKSGDGTTTLSRTELSGRAVAFPVVVMS